MKFSILNAFVDTPMSGNPASVCFMQEWLADERMLKIAAQFGYSETAFVVEEDDRYLLRWFTPVTEVDLCGHATMAAAHSIFSTRPDRSELDFETRSGKLTVRKDGHLLAMDFPARQLRAFGDIHELSQCLNTEVLGAVTAGPTVIAVVRDEATVADIRPDLKRIKALQFNALIPTATGSDVDFVSRFFGPKIGIPEDPITGAAHTGLAPYWSRRLGKSSLRAKQLSPRGGFISCMLQDDRVELSGSAEVFATGVLHSLL